MPTLVEVLEMANVYAAPDPDVEDITVPVLAGVQRQGDVLIAPTKTQVSGELVPREGVAVVRGEATGNTHILQSIDGPIYWSPSGAQMVLGSLHVPEGSTAYLIHTDEHGANGIAPGNYTFTGKREQAEEIRRVAD